MLLKETIQAIINSNNIVSEARKHTELHREGIYLVGACPFHKDEIESFYINPYLKTFCCYSCGSTGNIIDLVMKTKNLSFEETIDFFCEKMNISLPEDLFRVSDKKREKYAEQLYEINEAAVDFFKKEFKQRAKGYCNKRKINDETLEKFSVGYAPFYGNKLFSFLIQKGYTEDEIMMSGLVGQKENENGETVFFDKFWDRIMFPIKNIDGRIIGFGGRSLVKDTSHKYINSQDTPIFKKGENLYGLNFAKDAEYIILCEGNIDVIMLHQAGFTGATASLGTALTDVQAKLLKGLNKDIYISYDSDAAGIKAALKAIKLFNHIGVHPRIISYQGAKDPDEFIKKFGKDAFSERIKKAVPDYVFIGHNADLETSAEKLLEEMQV